MGDQKLHITGSVSTVVDAQGLHFITASLSVQLSTCLIFNTGQYLCGCPCATWSVQGQSRCGCPKELVASFSVQASTSVGVMNYIVSKGASTVVGIKGGSGLIFSTG